MIVFLRYFFKQLKRRIKYSAHNISKRGYTCTKGVKASDRRKYKPIKFYREQLADKLDEYDFDPVLKRVIMTYLNSAYYEKLLLDIFEDFDDFEIKVINEIFKNHYKDKLIERFRHHEFIIEYLEDHGED